MVSVVLTDSAAGALERVRAELGDDLTFVIGNGCCDSTAPFLFSRYVATGAEERVGEAAACPCCSTPRSSGCSTGARW